MISLKQFSAMNMVYQKYSFEYFLDSMDRLEIENIELWTGTPHLNCFIQSQSDAAYYKRKIEERNKKIVCVTPEQVLYPYNIAASNQELRKISLEYFYHNIELTATLGAKQMLCCAGWGDYDEDKEEAWKRSVEGLQKMTEKAKKEGIVLAFEILCPFESNLVYDWYTTKKMMEAIQDPAFGLCVDTVPVKLGGNTLKEFMETFRDRIIHIHLTDGKRTGHVPCGTGMHDIRACVETYQEYGYKKYITLEIGDMSWSVEPERATEIGFRTVKEIVA